MPKIQRRAPLTSWPKMSATMISAMRHDEDDQRGAPDLARRQERGRGAARRRAGTRKSHLPVDEMEGRIAEPLGDRRARRPASARCPSTHQHAEAPSSQRSTVHHQLAKGRTFGARDHRSSPRIRARGPASLACDELAKRVAALLEIRELIEGRAGRRQQHDGLGVADCCGVAQRLRSTATSSVPQNSIGNGLADRRGESLASPRRSDRLCATLANSGRSGSMPPSFGPAADDPVDVVEARERLFRGVGVGRLANH